MSLSIHLQGRQLLVHSPGLAYAGDQRVTPAWRTAFRTFGATLDGQELDGMQLDLVLVARQNKQLAVAILRARNLCVPVLRIEENPIRFAAEPCKCIEEEQGMTERRAVRGIQAVRIIGPIGCRLRRR
jgi:hypothetical protein